jgi:hypothetical protein
VIALILRERPVEKIRYVTMRGRHDMRVIVRARRHLRVPEILVITQGSTPQAQRIVVR